MSCGWTYFCETHNTTTQDSINHGDDFLSALYVHRDRVKALYKLKEELDAVLDWRFEVDITPHAGSDILPFLMKHTECMLCLVSEYQDRKPLPENKSK